MREMTEDVFLKDVSNHEMEVLKDDGIYRHLRFASKGEHSWNQHFNIVTWPGYLAYSGDMGCFVFSRLKDMFEFFRTRPSNDPAKLFINTDYWAEKLEAVDRCGGRTCGAMEFSEDRFKKRVNEYVDEWIKDCDLTDTEQEEIRSEIDEQVLCCGGDGEEEAHRALRDFSHEIEGQTLEFTDAWEWDLKEYTPRFVWCCYAIAWAIKQYDEAKAATQEQVA